jgi:hypothetical protein
LGYPIFVVIREGNIPRSSAFYDSDDEALEFGEMVGGPCGRKWKGLGRASDLGGLSASLLSADDEVFGLFSSTCRF